MAINFTVSYTFSPNTTIQSSQVNTNFSDEANVWTGLEGLTKTLAKLKMDVDPGTALEVATKQYVDHYSAYRRPVLQTNSSTVVNIETGIDGTSGDCRILFPDGNLRTDTSTGRIQCNLAQVAALSGAAQSGLRTGSVSNNTWYAIYAVKTTDNTSNFVAVADTVLPLQSNFATLNSNFGTNGWVYIGMIRNGDNSGSVTGILNFRQCGNMTIFTNTATGTLLSTSGIRFATSGSATSLTYSSSSGTGTTDIPNHFPIIGYYAGCGVGSGNTQFAKNSDTEIWGIGSGSARFACRVLVNPVDANLSTGSAASMDIFLYGWMDGVLGVGSNALL